MFLTFKNGVGSIVLAAQERLHHVRDLIFGDSGSFDDAISIHSFKKSLMRPSKTFHADEFSKIEGEKFLDNDLDCSRNLVVTSETLFRKGPIPIEHLVYKEQIHLSQRASLKEWDDSQQATSDNHLSEFNPRCKMLLSYFARLGSGEDDDDTVNLQFVQSLLDGGAHFNFTEVYGQSVFFAIVRDWHTDVAAFAIERGADVNHKDKYGRTPLHLAAAINYSEMVDFLISHGALIQSKTFGEEQSPLHYASRFNSVESIKVLIQRGAIIDAVDCIQRTPFHVATEFGSYEAVQYFLKLGAPTGVYDIYGNSIMAMMVEKLPNLAYEALNQFIVEDNAMRKKYYYLDRLEFDAKCAGSKDGIGVLKTIVMYNELDLIMHPVIRKLLEVNWKLFGKRHAIISNFWNILYTMLATAITYSLPFSPYDKQFSPNKEKSWKITLAILFFILTFYFWIKQIMLVRQNGQRDKKYKDYRLLRAKKQLKYFHPRWPEEEQFYHEECSRVQTHKSAFWQDSWNIFEWISLVFVLMMFTLHIVNVIQPNKDVFTAAKFISAISLLLVYFRLYKTLRIFTLFSEFTVLLGHVLAETIRILLIFMDFYIPYVFIIFMMFGGGAEDADRTKLKEEHELTTIVDVAYRMWILTFASSYPHKPLDAVSKKLAELAIGSYFILMTALFIFIYIGRMSQVFCRLYRHVLANATMIFASIIVNEDYDMNVAGKLRQRKYLRNTCGPMVVPFESSSEDVDVRKNMDIGVSHVTTKIEDIFGFLAKSTFQKESKKSINLNHLMVFNTEIEKLTQKQLKSGTDLDILKRKLSKEQQKSLDIIRETIQTRANNAIMKRRKAENSKSFSE